MVERYLSAKPCSKPSPRERMRPRVFCMDAVYDERAEAVRHRSGRRRDAGTPAPDMARTGRDLVGAMQASPCRDVELTPRRTRLPVRDVDPFATFSEWLSEFDEAACRDL